MGRWQQGALPKPQLPLLLGLLPLVLLLLLLVLLLPLLVLLLLVLVLLLLLVVLPPAALRVARWVSTQPLWGRGSLEQAVQHGTQPAIDGPRRRSRAGCRVAAGRGAPQQQPQR